MRRRSRSPGPPAATVPGLAAVATALAVAALLAMTALLAWRAVRSLPSFDGAMNLNVARSLAGGQGYGFRYDSFFAFPAQTDGPFILPAALVFRVFGISRVSAQAVGLLYLLAFAVLVPALLRRAGLPVWLAASAAAACLAMPGTVEYGANGYGEIPMLCWILGALLAAARAAGHPRPPVRLFALSGLLFGIAVLTKTAALIPVVPAGSACAAAAAPPGRRLRSVAAFAAGFAAPLAGWELFRLYALGSVGAWQLWWQLQLGQVALQSGSTDAALRPGPLLARLDTHLRILSGQVGIPVPLLACWLVLPGIAASCRLRRPALPATRLVMSALLLSTLSTVGWWLLLSPTGMAWLRRILPALLLQTCLVATLLPGRLTRPRALLAALLLVPQLGLLGTGLRVLRNQDPAAADAQVRRAVALMRSLPPDSVFFGVGWWQAPVLSLLSGRTVMNLDRWTTQRINALPHKFLLVDRPLRVIGGSDLLQVETVATLVPLLDTPEAAVYRILSVDPERPARVGPLTDRFDAAVDPVAHGGGWYPSAGGWAWVQPRSHVLLARGGQSRLVLDAAFWSELFPPRAGPRHLHVSAPGCLDRQVTIPGAGIRHLVLALTCPPAAAPQPLDVTLALDAAMPVPHQLDADTRLRGFEIRRIALEP